MSNRHVPRHKFSSGERNTIQSVMAAFWLSVNTFPMTLPRLATVQASLSGSATPNLKPDFTEAHLGEVVAELFTPGASAFPSFPWKTREELAEAIIGLPSRERTILTLYFYEELTMDEIGEVLGMKPVNVILLLDKAFGSLRDLLMVAYGLPS